MSVRHASLARVSASRAGRLHADAVDWQARVIAAGGSVPAATLAAVSTFAAAIANAGIRSSITRLNLLCGGSLTAALVPLYTSGTTGGAAVGNATDTNVNFVSGDYSESTGLKGNGTTKYLRTGVTTALLPSVSSIHLSHSGREYNSGSDQSIIGTYQADASYYDIRSTTSVRSGILSNASVSGALATSESHQIVSRTSTTLSSLYCGGSIVATNTASVTPATSTREFSVFALNLAGTFSRFNTCRLWCYSIGGGLTAEQARQFSLAVATFNFALGRI